MNPPQMNWKKWKMGLLVSVFTGLATGAAAVAIFDNATMKQIALAVIGTAAKDILLFLKQHPIENITDTGFILPTGDKPAIPPTPPAPGV